MLLQMGLGRGDELDSGEFVSSETINSLPLLLLERLMENTEQKNYLPTLLKAGDNRADETALVNDQF